MCRFTKSWFLLLFLIINFSKEAFGRKRLTNPSNRERCTDGPVVSTENGLLQGFPSTTIEGRKIVSFHAIPYGLPPIGPLRFQPPQKSLAWTGIRDASGQTPECIQIVEFSELANGTSTVRGQEDCLYLEVHAPQSALKGPTSKSLPVIVFIHGGSFIQGSGPMYGPYYLLDQDIVLVNINYRLGPFGFLSTGHRAAYGNAGMKDQVLALQWIQENIRSFGGNPKSVTIVGESAGGVSVQHLMLSPLSRGLFHRGISQSGTSFCVWSLEENVHQLANKTGALFGCQGDPEQLVSCLQKVPAEKLVRAPEMVKEWTVFPFITFAPVIEPQHPGAFLSQHPTEIYMQGKAANVPWITGINREEMSYFFAIFFQNTEAMAEVNSNWDDLGAMFLSIANSNATSLGKSEIANKAREFYLGARNAELNYDNRYDVVKMLDDPSFTNCALDGIYLHARYTSAPVYAYVLTFSGKYSIVQLYGQNAKDWGVAHIDDLIYLFNNTQHYTTIQKESDKNEYEMEKIMTSTWANFATFGIPYVGKVSNSDCKQKSIWKPIQVVEGDRKGNRSGYDVSSFQFLDLNLTPKMIKNPYVERYEFWNSFSA